MFLELYFFNSYYYLAPHANRMCNACFFTIVTHFLRVILLKNEFLNHSKYQDGSSKVQIIMDS